ncbi:hypothetical protein ACO0LF_12480 [Undibacterium sp. Di27W]|uniref:hypothetical protein n=1 Tax=Undibacterium sp. Di27W TaxID=3413036 RepID=UPI003BF35AEE
MILNVSQAHQNARHAGSLGHLDAGSSPAKIRIFTGVQPAPSGPESELLVEIVLTKPAGTVAEGVLTLTAASFGLIIKTGQATWARVMTGAGVTAFDCDVSDQTGDGVIKLEKTQLYEGGKALLTSAVLG